MIHMNPFFKDLGCFGWYLDIAEMRRTRKKLNISELARHWGVGTTRVNSFIENEEQHYKELLDMIKNNY